MRSLVAQRGVTPLHYAASRGRESASIKALVAAKADVHAKDTVRVGGGVGGPEGGATWDSGQYSGLDVSH